MEINKIYNEPCLETLKKMVDKSIDCVITSPPYWQLRDYGYEGQWGLEPTFQEYLEHLWEMMDEIYRVLKDEGTCWINLGDTYARGIRAKYAHSNQSLRKHEHLIEPNTKPDYNGLDKCLLLIPHRFAIGCIERGWILRNDIIWAKRNGMPESVTDRFTKKHEYIFFMTKSEKYYFDLDAIRDKVKDASVKRYEYDFTGNKGGVDRDLIGYTAGNKKHLLGEKPQYGVLDADFRNPIIEHRNLPEHEELRVYLSNARKSKRITIQEIEDIFQSQAPHHWFEKNGSYPDKNDWVLLKEILEFDDTYDSMMTEVELKSGMKKNNPKGKNPGDVSDFWDITTKPSSSKHYASYNDELLKKPILAGCPENGIIYDPFMGTGSTAEATIRANRKFIGSEMSREYIKICNERINPFLQQQKLF
jgi:DNA modification methylase